jgi:hypothetical protein
MNPPKSATRIPLLLHWAIFMGLIAAGLLRNLSAIGYH